LASADERTREVGRGLRWRRLQLLFDPFVDITPPVADMSAHSETGRSFSAVAPLVEGGDRDAEVLGELLDGEEPSPLFHAFDHRRDPVDSLPFQCTVLSTEDDTLVTGFSTGLSTLC
jgi:hypothetical protein